MTADAPLPHCYPIPHSLTIGVFDALQRGFLRSIVFGISVPDPSGPKRSSTRLIEQYEWRVSK